VPDRKPPPSVGNEREILHALLQYQRESFVRKVTGVDESAARASIVPSGTSLLWLTKHMARAEQRWFVERFAGQEPDVVDDVVQPDETLVGAIATYQRTWQRVDAIVDAEPTLDAPCRYIGDDPPVNLRWVLMHLLEETARHAGHLDILRELIDGTTGR
jgi:hypothetical protein